MNRAILLTIAALAAGCIDDPAPPPEETPAAVAQCPKPAGDDDLLDRVATPAARAEAIDVCAAAAVIAHLDALDELFEEVDHAE